MATTIVEVASGNAEVTQGYAIVVHWDQIPDDIGYAQEVLDALKGKRGRAPDIRDFIYEVWPELNPRYRED